MRKTLGKQICFGVTLAIATFALTISVVSIIAEGWWIAELLGHLRIHMIALLTICMAVFIIQGHRLGWLLLIPTLVFSAPILSLYLPVQVDANPHRMTIIHYNLDGTQPLSKKVIPYLLSQSPDLLFLQEMTPEHERNIIRDLPEYRIALSIPMPNSHGSALLVPMDTPIQVMNTETVHLPRDSIRPMLSASLKSGDQRFKVLSMQATRPRNASTSAFQKRELEELASWCRLQQQENKGPLILIGDINTTPWSSRLRRLLRDGNMKNSSNGYGVQPTWPAWLPRFLGLPIDHCIVSQEVDIFQRRTGPPLGSDHLPLIIEIGF